MRWAVTGGTGLVGRWIVQDLARRRQSVTVFSRRAPPPGACPAQLAHQPYDLGQPPPDLHGYGGVVHAAFDHVPGRYRGGEGAAPAQFVARNRDAALRLFETAQAAGVGQAVFLSSRAVLGDYPPGTLLTEDLPARPDTLYGEVKAEVETALTALHRPGFTTLSLRATGVYGPAGPGQRHKWADMIAAHRAGDTQNPRIGTEVHGADLADALWRAVQDGRHRLVHVSDFLLDRHDLLAAVNRGTGCKTPCPAPSDPATVSALDCTRLHALGWRPKGRAGFEAALPELIAQSVPQASNT